MQALIKIKIIILKDRQNKMASKPTLGSLLVNPQIDNRIQQLSNEKILFPKINIKLKKTHFTKYRSAFIDLQPQKLDDELKYHQHDGLHQRPNHRQKQLFKKMNTEGVHKQKSQDMYVNGENKRSLWKLNKNKKQSYTIESSQTMNLHQKSASKGQEFGLNNQRKQRLIDAFLNQSQVNKHQKFNLLTQIRQLNFSPIQPLSGQSNHMIGTDKNKDINQKIQKSNRIISLIEHNYKKGFFQSNKNQSSMKQIQQKLGLFSYLKRQFVIKRRQLTPSKLNDYFKFPSNKKLETKINENTRGFLKDKLHNDYHSYREVNRLRENLSKTAIKQQIRQKSKEFNDEYNKKYNVPYLSFLSLPKNLKIKVLQKITQNTERNERINSSTYK